MERINWHEYFMAQAKIAALRATCTRLKVGAVIVRENRIIASGYNGSVSDSAHCIDEGCKVVDGHCVRTVHAEANAVLQCAKFGVPTANTTLYVTHFPCLHCTKQLIQAGIKEVYYETDYRNSEIALDLWQESNIPIKKVELNFLQIDEKHQERNELISDLLKEVEASSRAEEFASYQERANSLLKDD